MIGIARTDTSVFGYWWWTVDRWLLFAVLVLLGVGTILVMAASPAVADRLGLDTFFFARRQVVFLLAALAVMASVALLTPLGVRRIAALGFVLALALSVLALIFGEDINGARRWLEIGPFLLQPSELLKPTFVVVTAWMLAEEQRHSGFPGKAVTAGLLALVCALLLAQPDIGMVVLVAAVWISQVFTAGLAFPWIAGFGFVALAGGIACYALLPHVASRIDRFIDPAGGDSYQVDTALQAFGMGGFFGRGPGEGIVKQVLPDAHTDFIFAVAGEEFGTLTCLVLVGLFAVIVLRGLGRILQQENYFVLLAASGLLTQFGLQAVINMGVNLNLLPAKGMTLPFISYGGSSLVALALGMGMVLALTRRRVGDARGQLGAGWIR